MNNVQNTIDYNIVYELTKNINILYVEDDKNFRFEIVEVFNDMFKSVDVAYDGEEALTKYNNYFDKHGVFYDMVITDINMPNMDGLTLINNIYQKNKMQQIIVISAHDDSNTLLELVNVGIEQFLLKPLEYNKVLTTLYNSALKLIDTKDKNEVVNIIDLGSNYKWDISQQILYCDTLEVKLTKKELLLINLFIKKNTKISTLEEIFYLLWEDEPHLATKESLKSIISRLRKKIPNNLIENVYGLGYRLIY